MEKEINTLDDLNAYIIDIIEHPEKATVTDIEKLKHLKLEPIKIHIKDRDHNSAVNAEALRRIVEYQDQIYNVIKIAKYGNLNARLYEEDKAGFDLYVIFKEGSLFEDIDLQPIINSVVAKMNGWQIFGTLAIGLFIIGVVSCFKIYTNWKRISKLDLIKMQEKVLSDRTNVEITQINAKTIQDVTRLAEQSIITSSKFLDQLSRINGNVEINGEPKSKAELAGMAKDSLNSFNSADVKNEDEERIIQTQVSGRFMVSRIELKVDEKDSPSVDKRTINLINIDTGEVLKDILVSGKNFDKNQRNMIMNAIDGKPLNMKMVIAKRQDGKIANVLLQECDGISFEEPSLF